MARLVLRLPSATTSTPQACTHRGAKHGAEQMRADSPGTPQGAFEAPSGACVFEKGRRLPSLIRAASRGTPVHVQAITSPRGHPSHRFVDQLGKPRQLLRPMTTTHPPAPLAGTALLLLALTSGCATT